MTGTSLIALDPQQQAVLTSIGAVEAKLISGRDLGLNPWAKAFFKALIGTSTINAAQLRQVDASYNPRIRGGASKLEYLTALDILIRSRGELCPLPLCTTVRTRLFPTIAYRTEQRRCHRSEISTNQNKRRKYKEETRLCSVKYIAMEQAWLSLMFCGPGKHKVWLSYWRDELEGAGVSQWEIKRLIERWWSRFWISSVWEDWRWSENMYELLNEIDYVLDIIPAYMIDSCNAAIPNRII